MKVFLVVTLFLQTFLCCAQDYTIRGFRTDSIFIGSDNVLEINGYYKEIPNAEMTIEKSRIKNKLIRLSSPDVRIRKRGYKLFSLGASREKKENRVYVFVADELRDTIVLSSHHAVNTEFFVLKNKQLIKSGSYPLGLIKQIAALKVHSNVPWFTISILGYRITVKNEDEILFDENIKGASLNHPEITRGISQLKKNGVVMIWKVQVKKPWSCGRMFRFSLKVE